MKESESSTCNTCDHCSIYTNIPIVRLKNTIKEKRLEFSAKKAAMLTGKLASDNIRAVSVMNL